MSIAFCLLMILVVIVVFAVFNSNNTAMRYMERSRVPYDQLQTAATAHETSSQEAARLARIVAHDLKNPVHAITSIASILLESSSLSNDDRELVDLLKVASCSLADLINAILPETAGTDPISTSNQPLDITDLMHRSVELMQYRAKQKAQTIRFDLTRPYMIIADATQLRRAFNNVLVNAIKFSPVNTSIAVDITRTGSKIQIAITDEGIGIPPEISDTIFHNSNQSNRTGTLGERSFGMGLPLSREIIHAHKGDIWFEAAPVAGTTFYISLPEC